MVFFSDQDGKQGIYNCWPYTAATLNIVMNLIVAQTCHVMGPLETLVLLRTNSLLTAAKRSWNKRT